MREESSTQVAVLGGGPGGYAAAFLAADLGLRVTLIDPERNPGGVCLYRGCIPSKALLHVAKLIGEARDAEAWGVHFGEPSIDLDKLRGFKTRVVERLTGGLGELARRRTIQYVRGRGHFRNPHAFDIEEVGGRRRQLAFDYAVVATGSVPVPLGGTPEHSPRFLDSTSALDLESVPERLLVVGGGYIGLELGSVYARLGSHVTLVEMTGSLLTGVDPDLVRPLARRLDGLFEEILLNTRVTRFTERGSGVEVSLEGEGFKNGPRFYDKVLVAVGRKPASRGLGLESTRAVIDTRGFIEVDEERRTAEPSIFAIGDVAGQPLLAHKATHEGRTAAEVIAGHKAVYEPWAMPAVVFTDPEIAWCGMSESEAAEQGRRVEVARFPWAASGRALTIDRGEGMTKLIVDPESERVLGVGVVGAGAAEIIAEGVLAIEMAAVASDLMLAVHPHPTLSETIMEAAEVFYGQSTDVYRPKKARSEAG